MGKIFNNFGQKKNCISTCISPKDKSVCDCCLPGLQAVLQFALDNGRQVGIVTIAPDQGAATEGPFFGNITTLVQFDNGDTVFPICNIEKITFIVSPTSPVLTPAEVAELLTILANIPIPKDCRDCCSEELRQLLQSRVNDDISVISTHKNDIITGTDTILGTGQGVVLLQDGNTFSAINLCFISKVEFE